MVDNKPRISSGHLDPKLSLPTLGCLGFLAATTPNGGILMDAEGRKGSIFSPGHCEVLEAEAADLLELLGRIIPDPEMADLRAAAHQDAQRQCIARLTDTQLGGALRHARALVKLFEL